MACIEDAAVLADELEEVERELYDTRELYFEEVRLAKVLADEVADLERERDVQWIALTSSDDELGAERTKAKSRDRWLGVALGVAFLLGGYVGFVLGCA